jgi:hypothetical protein
MEVAKIYANLPGVKDLIACRAATQQPPRVLPFGNVLP